MPLSSSHIMSTLLIFITLGLLLEPSLSATDRCHPNDKKALLKFKKSYKNAPVFKSWLPETDCCQHWDAVTCNDDNNRVTTLQFSETKLPGPIPDTIGDLPYLTDITFYKITGLSRPIPITITKLKNLTTLQIYSSNLHGTIPGFLSKLNKLTTLNLSNNKLRGHIPSSLSNIPGLRFLSLESNRLTGTIPESFLKLKDNDLHLSIYDNKLSGEIPASFRDFNFGSFQVSQNTLHGDASVLFGAEKSTYIVEIARNNFEFNMTGLRLNPDLAGLDISHNKIYGSLPKEMGNKDWRFLDVSYNRLCGQIPPGLLSESDDSIFSHNRCLCGAPLNITCN